MSIQEGRHFFNNKQYQEAIQCYTKAINDKKENIQYSLELRGFCYYTMDKYQPALEDYMAALALEPNNETLQYIVSSLKEKCK